MKLNDERRSSLFRSDTFGVDGVDSTNHQARYASLHVDAIITLRTKRGDDIEKSWKILWVDIIVALVCLYPSART